MRFTKRRVLGTFPAINPFSDSDWPSILNRPTFNAGTNTLTWVGPLGGGANNGEPVQQSRVLTNQSTPLISSAPGQVLQGFNCTDIVRIRHNNVILRQCYVHNTDFFQIEIDSGSATNVIVEDCLIVGDGTTATDPAGWNPDGGGGGSICRRCNFTNMVHAILIGENNMTIQDNWIHDLAHGGVAHTDCVEGTGGFTSLVIRHNAMYGTDTACVISQNEGATWTGLVIDHNILVMDNGDACIVIRDKSGGTLPHYGSLSVTNNLMGKPLSFSYNDIDTTYIDGPIVYTGNVDYITGAPVNIGD